MTEIDAPPHGWSQASERGRQEHYFGSEAAVSLCHLVPRPLRLQRMPLLKHIEGEFIVRAQCPRCLAILDEVGGSDV